MKRHAEQTLAHLDPPLAWTYLETAGPAGIERVHSDRDVYIKPSHDRPLLLAEHKRRGRDHAASRPPDDIVDHGRLSIDDAQCGDPHALNRSRSTWTNRRCRRLNCNAMNDGPARCHLGLPVGAQADECYGDETESRDDAVLTGSEQPDRSRTCHRPTSTA